MALPAATQAAELGRIVVANEHASTVQFVDLRTGSVLKNIATLKRPHEMVLDRNRGVAYIHDCPEAGATNLQRKRSVRRDAHVKRKVAENP
jgi:hypothetical protein